MSGTRIAIVVLVLIAIFVAVALFVGLGRDDGGTAVETKAWQKRLKSFVSDQQKLPLSDVKGVGVDGDRIVLTAAIPATTLTIRESDQNLRSARLRLLSGTRVKVEVVPKGADRPRVKAELKNVNDALALQVFREGATLAILGGGAGASTILRIEPAE